MADKERAKQIIAEIIKLSGGRLLRKGHLFKAFYFAHLYYAADAPDYLSDWPIVHMPRGPGMDHADELIDSMVREGTIEVRRASVGPYHPFEYELLNDAPSSRPGDAIDAIRKAVEFTMGKSAAELTEITHEYSNSWQDAKDGQELNIYLDLLDEPEYREQMAKAKELADSLREVW